MRLSSLPLSRTVLTLALAGALLGCRSEAGKTEMPSEESAHASPREARVPDWHKTAVIYEVNLRHYTPEGTFRAFQEHVPRLARMGVDILWFMPVHPVSVKNRKGELGSPYAVADYLDVNPDHGTYQDFKALVRAIHEAGMRIIIDWVPNHSGWDNPWITEHPDWYTKGADGQITDPINPETGESWGWTDVADLDYGNADMRQGMIDAMQFWVEDAGIDGFRVDVAHGVPPEFWVSCTDSLYAMKPLFMLAEAEVPELLNSGSFIMDYGWGMHHILNDIARSRGASQGGGSLVQGNLVEGEADQEAGATALDIDRRLAWQDSAYQRGYKMQFTSNHDENSWAGTEFSRMGPGHKAFAVLTGTFDGMPLIYSGQESAMDKQLEFFTKDEIPWGDFTYAGFYQTLNELKERNRALWNGSHGGVLEKIPTGQDEFIYAFTREREGDQVVVVLNLSGEARQFSLGQGGYPGSYTEIFSGEAAELASGQEMELEPWGYRVYSNK